MNIFKFLCMIFLPLCICAQEKFKVNGIETDLVIDDDYVYIESQDESFRGFHQKQILESSDIDQQFVNAASGEFSTYILKDDQNRYYIPTNKIYISFTEEAFTANGNIDPQILAKLDEQCFLKVDSETVQRYKSILGKTIYIFVIRSEQVNEQQRQNIHEVLLNKKSDFKIEWSFPYFLYTVESSSTSASANTTERFQNTSMITHLAVCLKTSHHYTLPHILQSHLKNIPTSIKKRDVYEFSAAKTFKEFFHIYKEIKSDIEWLYPSFLIGNTRTQLAGGHPEYITKQKIDDAWPNYSGKNVNIAVIDDGVDIGHPYLLNRLYLNSKEQKNQQNILLSMDNVTNDQNLLPDDICGYDFFSGYINTTASPQKTFMPFESLPFPKRVGTSKFLAGLSRYDDHGTCVAGIASIVAYGAKILPIKIFHGSTGKDFTSNVKVVNELRITEAFRYVGSFKDINIINVSWGIPVNLITEDGPLAKEIKSLAQKNIIVCAAAGNHKTPNLVEFPASMNETIAVGAIDYQGNKLYKYTDESKIDVYSYGKDVLTTDVRGEWGYNKFNTHLFSGTSAATPITSGIVALLQNKKKEVTPTEMLTLSTIRQILKDSVVNGLIDVNIALSKVE
ncbi:S8 family peptidase [Candidatus Uabimicrobium amorphum]|uniref:Serine protease n=1 Tax=Uabimicrobium amorphum TaxID=2596890 RepID=A0A5S9IR41_UABAM|nr:S8 family serine peptidase [Candidatus Uabimicrobium amorphum]BBM86573.1 serine protease [Candidatus Uabimicrobium amorphum]